MSDIKGFKNFIGDKLIRIRYTSISKNSNRGIDELSQILSEIKNRYMSDNNLSEEDFENEIFGSKINQLIREIKHTIKKKDFVSKSDEFKDTKYRLINIMEEIISH